MIKMTTFYATLKHHSLSRSPVIKFEGSLKQAKRTATEEFGMEFQEYEIIITDEDGDWVARKLVGDEKWTNRLEDDPLISRIGRALYGRDWQAAMARDLGVNTRTTQRYASQDASPPRGVITELAERLAQKEREISKVQSDVKEFLSD